MTSNCLPDLWNLRPSLNNILLYHRNSRPHHGIVSCVPTVGSSMKLWNTSKWWATCKETKKGCEIRHSNWPPFLQKWKFHRFAALQRRAHSTQTKRETVSAFATYLRLPRIVLNNNFRLWNAIHFNTLALSFFLLSEDNLLRMPKNSKSWLSSQDRIGPKRNKIKQVKPPILAHR